MIHSTFRKSPRMHACIHPYTTIISREIEMRSLDHINVYAHADKV